MKKRLRNQKGFTLIEIIAVLIILGILAAVAVPKFLNLTTDAQNKALDGALAAGMSTCSMEFARYTLANDGTVPTGGQLATQCNANKPNNDDFTYGFAGNGSDVDITVTWTDGTAGTGTATWSSPN